jgi:predicted phage terminase large subunit-like protein
MSHSIPDRRAFNALLATDLFAFLQRAFRDLDPRNQLLIVPFIELLIEELNKIATGATSRLIINLPPRHLKSILVSVVLPAWLLGRDPRLRIAVVSHSQGLARDLALKSRRLVDLPWYRSVFPQMRLSADRSGALDFETTEGGGRYAASMDTGITGRGFDKIIVDDPLSAQDARSAVARESVIEAYEVMIASRLDDPLRGVICIVHQRMHERDLTGHLMMQDGWHQISLPLIADEEMTYQIGGRTWTRRINEPLIPDLYPSEVIQRIRAERGEAIFAAQYQQNPTASIGELLRPEHIRYFDATPPDARRITISIDTATKTTESSSYTVFLVIASDSRRHYIVDVQRERLDPVQARDAAVRLIQHHRPSTILIEDASSGPGLARMLLEMGHRSQLRSTRGHGKEERFEPHLHYFVDGRILLKRNQPWTTDLVNEWLRFPFARFDDQVDAMSQYLEWVSTTQLLNPVLRGAGGAEARAAQVLWNDLHLRRGEHPMRPWSGGRRPLSRSR